MGFRGWYPVPTWKTSDYFWSWLSSTKGFLVSDRGFMSIWAFNVHFRSSFFQKVVFYHFLAYEMLPNGHECIKSENRMFGVFWTSHRTFFFINGVWPAVYLFFRGAVRRGQNLMNSCTFFLSSLSAGLWMEFFRSFHSMFGHVVLKHGEDMNY